MFTTTETHLTDQGHTDTPTSGSVSVFDAPSFPRLSTMRDRVEEAAERSALRREDGFAAGYQAGLDGAEVTIAKEIAEHRAAVARLADVAAALESAVADLLRRDHLALLDVEREVVAIGVGLAIELVGRELTAVPSPVIDALGRAAALTPDRGPTVVRVHPGDDATTREAVAADALTWPGDVTVVPDPTVEPGGCIVDVGPCRIDAQVGEAISRLKAALLAG